MSARVTSILLRALALATLLTGVLERSVPVDLQLFVAVSAQEPGSSAPIEVGLVPLREDPTSRAAEGGATVGNLTYHGGAVQHTQKVFTIFWNPTATPFPAGYQTTINQFVQDLNGSPYYAIASQHGDSTGNISTALSYGGTWLDTTNAIPNDPPNIFDLLDEVNRAKAANGWTSDANSYFQVYTPSGYGTTTNYCGFHAAFGGAFGLILFPAVHGSGGTCFPSGPFPNNQIVDAAINVSAHEIMETVTDPFLFGWYYVDWSGEIGDLCNFDFGVRAGDGSNVTLNGHKYLVQQQWSNAVSGCALSYIPPSVNITANGSDGPLTLQPADSLQIAFAADGGTPGFASPSDLYIGVSTPFGVFWLSTVGFTPTMTVLFHGPLPSVGPTPLFTIPNVSTVPSGSYVWFIVVTGAKGTVFDLVQTTIAPSRASSSSRP